MRSGRRSADDPRRSGVPELLRKLEPLACFALAAHAMAVQALDPDGWGAAALAACILLVLGLAGILGWRTTKAATVRGAVILALCFALLATRHPASGYMILWLFTLVTVYPLVLPTRRSAWVAVVVPIVYLLLVPLDAADGPLAVALVRALALATLAAFGHVAATAYRTAVGDRDDTLALLDTYLDSTPVGLGFWDNELRLRRQNAPLAALVQPAAGDAPGQPGGAGPVVLTSLEQDLRRVLDTGTEVQDMPVTAVDRTWTASLYPVRIGQRLLGVSGVFIDVTDQREAARALAHSALHDPLTGLANRVLFHDRLEMALTQAERDGHLVAVLFCDLDRFKVVNDSLGHAAGDELLRTAADRLIAAVRAGDTVARLGGDEFAVLCPRVHDLAEATAVAERICRVVRLPMRVAGQEARSTMSVGVTVCGPGEEDVVGLLRDADVAMYNAKELGRDRVAVFDSGLRLQAAGRFELHRDLRRAVEEQHVAVAYQPVVALPVGLDGAQPPQILGLEALARWTRPGHGAVPPGVFIPIAEDLGLVPALGEHVLRTACSDLRGWRERTGRPLTVAVNLSARQLAAPDCADVVRRVLAEAGLPPEALQLEITESVLMTDLEHSARGLRSLRELGVRLAIDDFGTGYSSLAYLRDLPVDVLKVDRSFTSRLPDDVDIFAFIVDLARAIGATTVVEGVETHDQLALVTDLGCHEAQGYLISRPLTPEQVASFVGLDVVDPA